MFDDTDFRELLTRVQAGDGVAVADFVQTVEPRVRAAVRNQINDLKLRRLLDSTDISQAVLARFFLLAAEGQFDVANPNQLAALLITMARNRLRDEARREFAECRGGRRAAVESDHLLANLSAADPTPSRVVSSREITDILFARLPDDVR